MDYEADFQQTVRETVGTLTSRGKRTIKCVLTDEDSVSGWLISSDSGESVEERGNPGRGQYWFHSTLSWQTRLLLTEDETIVVWRQEFFESTEGEENLSRTVSPAPNSLLVGSEGAPFSRMKEELQRLPYR